MSASSRLYLITPPDILGKLDDWMPTYLSALDAGDIACLQIRLKDVSDDDILRVTDALRDPAQERGIAVLLNDRPDLAAQSGCDGVHIGQDDMPYAAARKVLKDGIIGVTCHNSRHLAMEAAEAGAEYVAFGAFFPTNTKEVKYQADIDLITWWTELMEVPLVAIGGITTENAMPLIEAGADFLAISAGVWNHPKGAGFAVQEFNKMMEG